MTVASIDEFLDFMSDQVEISSWTGADAFGAPTYGSPVNYPAYIEGKISIVRNLQGEQQVSTVRVYVGGIPGAKAEDKIVLPARFVPNSPAIISISQVSDEAGPHHEEIFC